MRKIEQSSGKRNKNSIVKFLYYTWGGIMSFEGRLQCYPMNPKTITKITQQRTLSDKHKRRQNHEKCSISSKEIRNKKKKRGTKRKKSLWNK